MTIPIAFTIFTYVFVMAVGFILGGLHRKWLEAVSDRHQQQIKDFIEVETAKQRIEATGRHTVELSPALQDQFGLSFLVIPSEENEDDLFN